MGRAFYSVERLGAPFEKVRELFFVLPRSGARRQRSRYPKLVIVLSGRCLVRAGDDFLHLLEAGDMMILPKPCYHYYQLEKVNDPGIYVLTIFFDPQTFHAKAARALAPGPQRELVEIAGNLLSQKRYVPQVLTSSVSTFIGGLRSEYDGALPGWEVRFRATVHSLVVELWRMISLQRASAPTRKRNRVYVVNQVKELLAKARDSPVTLARIAQDVHWSEEHLARVFKKETGITVMEHLRRIRIDMAKVRLLTSSDGISSIADGLGFETVGTFCRVFKQIVGQTPSEFRENHPGERG